MRSIAACAVIMSMAMATGAHDASARSSGNPDPSQLVLQSADLHPVKVAISTRGGGRDDDLMSMIYGLREPKSVSAGQRQGRFSRYEAEFRFRWGRIESSATLYQTHAQAMAALRQQGRSCRADPPATSLVKTRLELGQLTIECFVARLDFGLFSIRWAEGNTLASISIWEDRVYNYDQAPALARRQDVRIRRVLAGHR